MENDFAIPTSPEPNLSNPVLKRHTVPQLRVSTWSSSTSSTSSPATSERSPRLSPCASPQRNSTFPISKADADRDGYMRGVLSNWEADPLPIPRFILDNCADELPITKKFPNTEQRSETFSYQEGTVDTDFEPSLYALSNAGDSITFGPSSFDQLYKYSLRSSPAPQSYPCHFPIHSSDSGIGSSTASGEHRWSISSTSVKNNSLAPPGRPPNLFRSSSAICEALPAQAQQELFEFSGSTSKPQQLPSSPAVIASSAAPKEQTLSDSSIHVMKSRILKPLIEDKRFNVFNDICHRALELLDAGNIRSLRDLEKQVLHTASSIRQPDTFLEFSKAFLECLKNSIPQIPETELTKQSDRPYDEGYFLDILQPLKGLAREINTEDRSHPTSQFRDYLDCDNEMDLDHDFNEDMELFSSFHQQTQDSCEMDPTYLHTSDFSGVGIPYYAAGQPTCNSSASLPLQQQQPAHAVSRPTYAGPHTYNNFNLQHSQPVAINATWQSASVDKKRTLRHSRSEQHYSVGSSFVGSSFLHPEDEPPKRKKQQQQAQLNTHRKVPTTKTKPALSDDGHGYACPWPKCDLTFARKCDLTKHEKTHSRPHKCPNETCKYREKGFPTEKEKERHISDKHSDSAPLHECKYKPCSYKSKRLSNCKQHMEKAHGYTYIRTKNVTKIPKPATIFVQRQLQGSNKLAPEFPPASEITELEFDTSQSKTEMPLDPQLSTPQIYNQRMDEEEEPISSYTELLNKDLVMPEYQSNHQHFANFSPQAGNNDPPLPMMEDPFKTDFISDTLRPFFSP